MITYQLVCVLVAVLVTGALVRCQPEDSQDLVDSKPESEEGDDLQSDETTNLLSAIFGKFDSMKGKSFYNFGFPGKNGCYKDPCYPYGGGGGGGGGTYYRYIQVPVSYGGSASSPGSSYYYYQGGSAPAAPRPSYSPGFYYLIGIPVNKPTVRVVPQPVPYRPVYAPPTVHCSTSPCGNVPQYIESRPYYGYGSGGDGQFLAGASIAGAESQATADGTQQIIGAASVPVLKGSFTPSETFPEIEKPIDGVPAAAGSLDAVKC